MFPGRNRRSGRSISCAALHRQSVEQLMQLLVERYRGRYVLVQTQSRGSTQFAGAHAKEHNAIQLRPAPDDPCVELTQIARQGRLLAEDFVDLLDLPMNFGGVLEF